MKKFYIYQFRGTKCGDIVKEVLYESNSKEKVLDYWNRYQGFQELEINDFGDLGKVFESMYADEDEIKACWKVVYLGITLPEVPHLDIQYGQYYY